MSNELTDKINEMINMLENQIDFSGASNQLSELKKLKKANNKYAALNHPKFEQKLINSANSYSADWNIFKKSIGAGYEMLENVVEDVKNNNFANLYQIALAPVASIVTLYDCLSSRSDFRNKMKYL
ncbi:hypothetical protein KY334_05640 [Candidatus Woesearchaeota archaeon]|nr:hypothetical protein [Candidatus Woesearchaeota archaeon]